MQETHPILCACSQRHGRRYSSCLQFASYSAYQGACRKVQPSRERALASADGILSVARETQRRIRRRSPSSAMQVTAEVQTQKDAGGRRPVPRIASIEVIIAQIASGCGSGSVPRGTVQADSDRQISWFSVSTVVQSHKKAWSHRPSATRPRRWWRSSSFSPC